MPKKAKKSLDLSLPIFQLKISLQHIAPPIWRRVQVNDCDLEELHDIIQAVMGREEMHPHAFVIDGEDYDEEGDEPSPFPIGTIAYYGPDDKITTKIVAVAVEEEGAEAIIKRWVAPDVTANPKVAKEIDRFFKKHGVSGDCPFCPWWKGKQGSGAKE